MSVLSKFRQWWEQLPVETRMKMNQADMEFAWISASNAHEQLEYQARHAAANERAAIVQTTEGMAMTYSGETREALMALAERLKVAQ
jgi:hypothetical protein